jgi:hypothetical protein
VLRHHTDDLSRSCGSRRLRGQADPHPKSITDGITRICVRHYSPRCVAPRQRLRLRCSWLDGPYGDDQALIAAWTCKTALVSLLVTSTQDRGGDGVPPSEYTALYEQRDRMEPLPFSHYWIGSYNGDRAASIWVTPFVIEVIGAGTPPDIPSGYAMTLVLGKLLVQGIRFTEPALQAELTTGWGFLDIWPPTDTFPWPTVGVADDATLDQMNRAQTFVSQTKGARLSPFKPATELPASTVESDLIRLPLYCWKHEALYPAILAQETSRTGKNYVFLTGCACLLGYIIRTEADGAHMKRYGEPEAIEAAYEE